MSGCLLDTHAFLWLAEGNERLSKDARDRIDREPTDVYLSMASIWEMAIKISLGKLRLTTSLESLVHAAQSQAGIQRLDIHLEHVAPLASLPLHHRDPFDRLLAVQCLAEDLDLISGDADFDAYGVRRIW